MATATITEETQKIDYSGMLTWRELGATIKQFQRLHPNEPLSNDIELANICRSWFAGVGALDDFDPTNIESILKIVNDEVEIEAKESNLHQEENLREFESKSLDSQSLEILLEEYDKHHNLEEIIKNPLLVKIDRQSIQKVIEQKIRLQAEAIRRGESERTADLDSDLQITTEAKLIEAGVEASKAEKIAILAADISVKAESLSEVEIKINEVLETEKVSSQLKSEIKEVTVNKTAEIIVATEEEKIVDNLVEKLAQDYQQITPDKAKILREVIKERLDLQVRESLPKVEDKIVVAKDGITKAESLTDKIVTIVGEEGNNERIGLVVREVEKETDRLIAVRPEEVGRYRRVVLEKSIRADLVNNGVEVEVATTRAKYWGELVYPRGQEAEMVTIDEASVQKGRENGYEGANLKLAVERGKVVTRLVMSPKSIEENVSEIRQNGEGVNNEYKNIGAQLDRDGGSRKSLEYIRGVVNFRKKFDGIVGRSSVNLGKIFKLEGLQKWGRNLLTRAETRTNLINVPTIFGWAQSNNLGIPWALKKISNAWLGAGLKPIQIGGVLGKLGGSNLVSFGKIASKKIGLNILTAAKGLAIKLFPKLATTALGVVTGPIGWILTAVSFIDFKKLFQLVVYVVGGVFVGLLVVIPLLTMGPISSLVPTAYSGPGASGVEVDETGKVIPPGGGPGLNGGKVDGECSVADAVTAQTNLQCVASSMNPNPNYRLRNGGTVCNQGCGPTSVSMILLRLNSKYTPDFIYNFEPSLMSGSYGSSLGQNMSAINRAVQAERGISNVAAYGGCRTAQDVANYICKGHKIVLMGANFIGHGGHIFLAVGVKNGIIQVKDPYPPYSNGKTNVFDGSGTPGSVAYDGNFGCIVIDADKLR